MVETKSMYPDDMVEQIVADMIGDPDISWSHDEDTGVWHVRHKTKNLDRESYVSRDHAFIWLYHDLRDLDRLRASIRTDDKTGPQRGDQTA
ncbi:hypothetical protein PBI_GRAY_92 [Gordonia phage Gray]|nr:hypothetical protein PBI_GRAY_92 [Gordonia phage Gray]